MDIGKNMNEQLNDVNSFDKSLLKKIRLTEALGEEEKKIIFSVTDAFLGKKKLNDGLSDALHLTH
ncbi:MAG TPA: hypothetical protein VIH57_10460 [Bacteroidales bacterium]